MNILIIKVFNQNSTWKQRLVVWPPDNALLDLSGSDRGINTNIYISTHSAKYFLFSYHIFSIQMTKCSVCLTVLTQMRHLTHCLLCDLSWWSSSWARLGNSRPHCPHLCSIVQYSTVQYSTVQYMVHTPASWEQGTKEMIAASRGLDSIHHFGFLPFSISPLFNQFFIFDFPPL